MYSVNNIKSILIESFFLKCFKRITVYDTLNNYFVRLKCLLYSLLVENYIYLLII